MKLAFASEFSDWPLAARGDFGDIGGDALIGKRFARGMTAGRFFGWSAAVVGINGFLA